MPAQPVPPAQHVLIKRYGGTRLYRPDASRYLSLEDVERLVADGTPIEVRDAATGADITPRTLRAVADLLG